MSQASAAAPPPPAPAAAAAKPTKGKSKGRVRVVLPRNRASPPRIPDPPSSPQHAAYPVLWCGCG